MKLKQQAEAIASWQEFSAFLRALQQDLQQNPAQWENDDLSCYLGAMAAWVGDMEGYYAQRGEGVPGAGGWQALATIMLAARVYE
ncbi:MAG: hypothetical protein HC915_14680 [Anaerolineae bacterium]|nr:hypothetical protein [Anaerolineae bacterium]